MSTTLSPSALAGWPSTHAPWECLHLTLVWCREEPHRVGEVIQPGPTWGSIGRGPAPVDAPLLSPLRQRPGHLEPRPPFTSPHLSRQQWRVRELGDRLEIENVGRRALLENGRPVAAVEAREGALLEVQGELLFLVQRRPAMLPPGPPPETWPAFGAPDALGLIGEGPAAWVLRRQIRSLGPLADHVLITGPSGAGKERVALALHQHSARGHRPAVARSAATLPEGLIEAELFGNTRGYPTPAMAARPGLVGEADGGSLIFDELGELPPALQARLLRLMDDGEYHRLGDARARRADLRVIAMTNRPEGLKHDVAARFTARLEVPGLDRRREDVPLLAAALVARRWEVLHPGGGPPPRLTPALVRALLRHPFTTHVRELDAVILTAALEAEGGWLDLGPGVGRLLEGAPRGPAPPPAPSAPGPAEPPPRLVDLRRHGLNPAACGADPTYPGNRQTADLHLRLFMVEALERAGALTGGASPEVLAAAADWLAGAPAGPLFDRARMRLETFTRRLASHADPAHGAGDTLEAALRGAYKAAGGRVARLARALARGVPPPAEGDQGV